MKIGNLEVTWIGFSRGFTSPVFHFFVCNWKTCEDWVLWIGPITVVWEGR